MKVYISIAIVLLGSVCVVAFHDIGTNNTLHQSSGILIDFGDYKTTWTDADTHTISEPLDLLDYACKSNAYTYTVDTDGKVSEINGVSNTATSTWGLWTISEGESKYTKSNTYDLDAKNFEIVTWAYCSEDGEPTVAVDASGTSIYGYKQTTRLVTLSPVATEIAGSLGAADTIVGTDRYSNYPSSITAGKNDGTIMEVGTYTDPSYESIIKVSPNLVVCDGSQYNHVQMAQTMRNSNVNSILLYDGESISTICDNIFILGTAMHYELRAVYVIKELTDAIDELETLVAGQPELRIMITLSSSTSPYVAAGDTYASDIAELMNGINIYHDFSGWVHINSEYIGTSERYGDAYNPDIAIILSSDGTLSANETDYNRMLEYMSSNWKSTQAYKTGEIYLLTDKLGEMTQRSGPRFAQFSELVARIICPSAFTDGITIPKYLGNNYEDYLTITKDLGFDS